MKTEKLNIMKLVMLGILLSFFSNNYAQNGLGRNMKNNRMTQTTKIS